LIAVAGEPATADRDRADRGQRKAGLGGLCLGLPADQEFSDPLNLAGDLKGHVVFGHVLDAEHLAFAQAHDKDEYVRRI
jgi:hypothetical protein